MGRSLHWTGVFHVNSGPFHPSRAVDEDRRVELGPGRRELADRADVNVPVSVWPKAAAPHMAPGLAGLEDGLQLGP